MTDMNTMHSMNDRMSSPMQRRRILMGLVSGVVGMAAAGRAIAAAKTYKYRCPKCKLIQEYGSPGVKKCPNDGSTMIRMN